MKFTLSWLKDHLDTDATLDSIVETLTLVGLEVEGVEDPGAKLKGYVIAQVVEAKPHPNADRLQVLTVEAGNGPLQVVCGAPNARAGLKGVFSPPGTYIPGKGITLQVGSIRGVESFGMMCSEAELEISDNHDGIIELPADAPVGVAYAEWAGLDDPVIDVAVTPNRADALGVHGIARDLAAAELGKLKDRTPKQVAGKFPCPVGVTLDFAGGDSLCPAFALRLVRGVKNGPSPDWLQARLRAIGLRPINALVDITNFMTFDRGRPLHVFDAAKVKGNLVVRRARAGESLLALDGKTYALDNTMCVIADDTGVESLAGIMGGEVSGCSDTTTDVLIESALWNELNIAQTGRKLGLNSDARYRFERGVDPAFCLPGLELATQLVLDFCGGEPSELVVAGKVPDADRVIQFPVAEVKRLTGVELKPIRIANILRSLGFHVVGQGDTVKVAVPSWRADVEGKADLVEEVVRILGLDNVPAVPFPRGPEARRPVLTTLQLRTRRAKRTLAARGMAEAVTWSFVSKPEAETFGGGKPELALANPIAADLSDMRPSLIPGLLGSAQRNADRGYPDAALFEVGQVFAGDRPQDQSVAAAGIRRGLAGGAGLGRHWTGSAAPGVFDAKADALAVLAACGAPMGSLIIEAGGPAWCHPGRSGTIKLGPNVFGWFGEMHPKVLETLEVDGPVAAFEVILDKIPEPKARPTRAKPLLELSAFQPVVRDFAFVVDKAVKAGDLVRAAQSVDKKLITEVGVFDVYEGPGLGEGKKSVAVAVTLQPREKTLTDAEIEAVAGKILAEVTKKTGATLRG
ncbi:phenylalanine--tRNA ligase subunit beta [Blastochloris viridis]|uniref:Phenylalanine--tRNA ligase beta subunit n=1 Tax=Blastochloris viridis TaxID=1079 RepID=A0A0H5BFM8_BLAVI|nr:phenylalanine--tRNA ligase subunit beta [Blastochloris viridis]ALK10855.1 Phenylalanine--tRNA ligase beta subunit [Blastochloris viridis]BAR99171.1 phenylalanyl-tRNA synthetase beta chain [Blastochloris viridis]CUU43517.1 Phenylalanine--tRNA ligase beta subunit [Blastochloris viridis]